MTPVPGVLLPLFPPPPQPVMIKDNNIKSDIDLSFI